MMGMEEKQEKCLNPACEQPGNIRGLCAKCYQTARVLVTRKQTTWEKLEAAGKSKPRWMGSKTKWFMS